MSHPKRIIISKVFTPRDAELAEIDMPIDLGEAREINPSLQIGRLPKHGAELGGKLVEECPGSGRLTAILEENLGACEVCSVEFSLTPERKK